MEQSTKSIMEMFEPKLLVQNSYLFGVLSIFLVMYGPRLQPKLPEPLRNLFNNPVFRAVVLFLVAYISSSNFQSSIVITIIFLVTMNLLHTDNVLETFREEGFVVTNGTPVSSCKSYNPNSYNLIGTAFYPLNDNSSQYVQRPNINNNELKYDGAINYNASVKSITQ